MLSLFQIPEVAAGVVGLCLGLVVGLFTGVLFMYAYN